MSIASKRRYEHTKRKEIYNTAHYHKPVMVIDPLCAKPYFISKQEYRLYQNAYTEMGLSVIIGGNDEM